MLAQLQVIRRRICFLSFNLILDAVSFSKRTCMNLLELRFGFHRKEADWHIDLFMHTKRGSVVYLRQGGYAFIGVS